MSPPPAGWRRRHGSAQGWGVTAGTPAPLTARALAARDAVFGQLPHVCRTEVEDLWCRCRADDADLDVVVCMWAAAHHLNAPWLVARLVGGIADGATVEEMADPMLWWDRADFECSRRAVPHLAQAEGRALAAHDLTRDWPILHEIAADPANETLDQFLGRARAHYAARAEVVTQERIERMPLTREQARDARWLLLHRVKRLAYARIAHDELDARGAPDRVMKAVRRLAAAAGV